MVGSRVGPEGAVEGVNVGCVGIIDGPSEGVIEGLIGAKVGRPVGNMGGGRTIIDAPLPK